MSISNQEVRKIAKLSRLSFSDEAYQNFQTQLSGIMDMIDQIQEVDCENVEPLTSVTDASLRMREDVVTNKVDIDELFSNTPGKDALLAREIKCFIVPKVVE